MALHFERSEFDARRDRLMIEMAEKRRQDAEQNNMKIAALQAKHAADAQRAADQRVQQEQRSNDQRAAQQFKMMQPPRGRPP